MTVQSTSPGTDSPFDICEMIVSEEFYLDEENPPSPAIQSYGYAARDRIRAAKREAAGGVAQGPTAPPPANGLPTLDEYRNNLVEECAKAVEETMWTLPLYAPNNNINVATGEAATIVIRQAAEAVRALAIPSTDGGGGK